MDSTFRPRNNFAWALVSTVLIVLFAANSILVGTTVVQRIIELGLCCILLTLTYRIWVRPKMVLTEEVITVVNPFRTVVIPCNEVRDLETKWALAIVHDNGTTRVWVAPVTGKRRWIADKTFGLYGRAMPMTATSQRDTESMSESLSSVSGQAAFMIREHLKRLH